MIIQRNESISVSEYTHFISFELPFQLTENTVFIFFLPTVIFDSIRLYINSFIIMYSRILSIQPLGFSNIFGEFHRPNFL
uniref:7TM_GPCR_Srx domain-containing protein n=1 Tax=Caenorhabditis tropicalis TaxID=1561998 RepID=A0A1I7UBZ4_9PELO